jgi:hypothetical protein
MVRMNTHLCDLDQWPFCSVQQLKPDLVVAKVACLQGETAASRHVDPVPDQNILNAAAGIKTVQRSARECPWKYKVVTVPSKLYLSLSSSVRKRLIRAQNTVKKSQTGQRWCVSLSKGSATSSDDRGKFLYGSDFDITLFALGGENFVFLWSMWWQGPQLSLRTLGLGCSLWTSPFGPWPLVWLSLLFLIRKFVRKRMRTLVFSHFLFLANVHLAALVHEHMMLVEQTCNVLLGVPCHKCVLTIRLFS